MMHDPLAPVTVHVFPPGDAVTVYEVGEGPELGGVTVMVALSGPATTVAAPGALGIAEFAALNTVTAGDAELATESAIPFLFATAENVYETPAVSSLIVHPPLAPVTVHVFPPGEEVTMYELGVGPELGRATVIVALSIPATTVGALVALKRKPAFEVSKEKVNDAESCPVVSCSAALFSVLSTAGAVYVTDAVVDV